MQFITRSSQVVVGMYKLEAWPAPLLINQVTMPNLVHAAEHIIVCI